MSGSHYLFVTGRLAEFSLRRLLNDLAPQLQITADVAVLPITVAALATIEWIGRHLTIPPGVQRIILPGLCQGDLDPLRKSTGIEVVRGPADLRDLPDFFQIKYRADSSYGEHDIEIIAEINHAPRLTLREILAQADALKQSGADRIDVGCDPGDPWPGVANAVRELCAAGHRVSIDSFNPVEVEQAVRAGADLVLSVNHTNLQAARNWGCEVVVLPDDLANLGGLDHSVECLSAWGIQFRIDPILEPIGLGFAPSLGRYLEVRRRYSDASIMMGIGNLTELTDVDSSGINVALLGFCQEVGIHSVLTTQVINWARSSVRELDLARRLVFHAVRQKTIPKRLEPNLILLRDPRLHEHGFESLLKLAGQIKDANIRLFAEAGMIHAMNSQFYLQGTDPFLLFEEMNQKTPLDPGHAFYLGYEMSKAVTALTLGKNYIQDQALRWGFLTLPEVSHRATIKKRDQKSDGGEGLADHGKSADG